MIELSNIRREYRMGDTTVSAVNGIHLTVERGEFVAIMGASGSGKSDLLYRRSFCT